MQQDRHIIIYGGVTKLLLFYFKQYQSKGKSDRWSLPVVTPVHSVDVNVAGVQ